MAFSSFRDAFKQGQVVSPLAQEDPTMDHGGNIHGPEAKPPQFVPIDPQQCFATNPPVASLLKKHHDVLSLGAATPIMNFHHDAQVLHFDLGMEMVLSSVQCAPMSTNVVLLAGFAPLVTNPNF
ncbi:hypothetical protein Ancab_029287 [Ancistrocladus abbreviatus]